MVNKFYGNEATVKIGSNVTTVTTDSNLEDQIDGDNATDFSAEVTEITVTDPEAGVDVLNVFGTQLKEESRPDLVEVDFTMVFSDIDMFEHLHGSKASITTGSSWVRISGGDQTGSRPDKAILFKLAKGSKQINLLLNEAWFQSGGELGLAADGRAEWSATAVCLVEDRYIEQKSFS